MRTDDLIDVARLVSRAVGHVEVTIAGRDSPLPWSCADIVAAQDRGDDPTAGWRETVRSNQSQLYAVEAPHRVAAAFVLQWYLGVVAVPVAVAAVLTDHVLPARPDSLRFDLSEDEGYPVAVSVAVDQADEPVMHVDDPAARLRVARQRYADHAERFVAGYRPPVKMSTLQRSGMITDAWRLALSAAGAAGQTAARADEPSATSDRPGDEPPWRVSCCFIFALPGAAACARCPRRRPVRSAGPARRSAAGPSKATEVR